MGVPSTRTFVKLEFPTVQEDGGGVPPKGPRAADGDAGRKNSRKAPGRENGLAIVDRFPREMMTSVGAVVLLCGRWNGFAQVTTHARGKGLEGRDVDSGRGIHPALSVGTISRAEKEEWVKRRAVATRG